jgi:hypothetical protein
VWRRGKLGTDIWHRDRWEAFKKAGGTCTAANEEYNPIYLHRHHPLIHESRFDLDDRHAARIMLGRMLRIVMKSRKKLHCAAAGMLADQILERPHDLAKAHTSEGMAILGQGFINSHDQCQRKELGKTLICKNWRALTQHPYIGGFALALIPSSTATRYLRDNEQPNEAAIYRNTVDRFLHAYHSSHIKERPYAELMHIYYVLQGILLQEDVPAATRLTHIDAPSPPRSSSPQQSNAEDKHHHKDERGKHIDMIPTTEQQAPEQVTGRRTAQHTHREQKRRAEQQELKEESEVGAHRHRQKRVKIAGMRKV